MLCSRTWHLLVLWTALADHGRGGSVLYGMQIYQSFYCRMNDPSYIKDLKLQLLSAVADDSNAYEIVTELTEYVADIDEHLAREAVRAVGRIALEVRHMTSPDPHCCCTTYCHEECASSSRRVHHGTS